MSNIFFSFFAFVLTISFLVFIHEYGHFWVARRFGVRIEKFSIGFGKPIIKWQGKRDYSQHRTEYSLSWIPLGGYVKMYGEEPSSDNDIVVKDMTIDQDNVVDDKALSIGSFSALPPFKRLLIAFAGPAVNIIFAVFALWLLFIIGVPALKPMIGSVADNSTLARANISDGDNIVAINGRSVDSMTDAAMSLVDALGNNAVPLVAVDKNGRQKTAQLDLSTYQAGSEMAVEKLAGFNWAIDEVVKKQPVTVSFVGKVTPAERAGLLVGDTVLRVDEQAVYIWQDFVDIVQASPAKELTLLVERKGQTKTLSMTTGVHPNDKSKGYAGVSPKVDVKVFEPFKTIKRYGWLEALPKSISANYLQGELMLKTLWRLVAGKASIENLGGPLSIADYSGKSLSAGYVTYFKFLASISLILAVMNLLPIPVLDGGHIAMCLVEMVRGKPLSERTLDWLMRLGGSILLTFMLFVISVDVWRYLFK